MSRIRIGVVGAGIIARRHVRRLAPLADVQIAAVADPQDHPAGELTAAVGARPYADARAMLHRAALDAV